MPESAVGRAILLVVAVLAILALLAYARGAPGDDGRAPDKEHAARIVRG